MRSGGSVVSFFMNGRPGAALWEFDEITDPRTVDAFQAEDGQWLCREGFPEVPAEMLAPGQWFSIYAGRLKYKGTLLSRRAELLFGLSDIW